MYVPDPFRQDDREAALRLVAGASFGLLAVGLEAAHVPFVLDRERQALQCHVARANPIWRQALGAPVLAVFSGPHAYVSPDWYENTAQVPTWNFLAVHVSGTASRLPEEALEAHLRALVAQEEARLAKAPWTPERMDAGALTALRRGIVGIEIPLERVEAKWKLSQNRGPADRRSVRTALERQGGENNLAVAALMADNEKEPAHDR
ncbi:MAG: FMN-binding negative transcriptional regulator [Alphaproteobacteria bacterium]|nr:FMN-binding negative transcriptional regulator [Alphaproteobacteria bacterium]